MSNALNAIAALFSILINLELLEPIWQFIQGLIQFILIIAALLLVLFLIAVVFLIIKGIGDSILESATIKPKRRISRANEPKPVAKEFRPDDLWLSPELVSLCGNENLAVRLVVQISDRNPLRDWEWCNEKAIYDLERDRRR